MRISYFCFKYSFKSSNILKFMETLIFYLFEIQYVNCILKGFMKACINK